MPRPRTNDSLGVSDTPDVVSDPIRVEQLVAEYKYKLAYIKRSYEQATDHRSGDKEFNQSLIRLRRAVERKRPSRRRQRRLHPDVEIVISHHACRLACERTGSVEAAPVQQDVDRAGRVALEELRPRRGRPAAEMLRYHVAGLMALIQHYTGKPVLARKTSDSVYQPNFAGVGRMIEIVAHAIEPALTTQLANLVSGIRREYAGKPMRFEEFFPGYGLDVTSLRSGELLADGSRIQQVELNIPIYCP